MVFLLHGSFIASQIDTIIYFSIIPYFIRIVHSKALLSLLYLTDIFLPPPFRSHGSTSRASWAKAHTTSRRRTLFASSISRGKRSIGSTWIGARKA